jgi:type I restriction enzyme S subunit
LYYFLSSNFFLKQLFARTTQSAQENIGKEEVDNMLLIVPPLADQLAIGHFLSDLDSRIDINRRMNRTLEAIAQAVFERWFVDFEFPNEESEPYKSSGGEMSYNEQVKKEIPKGWRVSEIGSELKVATGGTPSRSNQRFWQNGTIPWIASKKTEELRIVSADEYITEEAKAQSSTQEIPSRTTVLAIIGNTIGQVSLVEFKCCINQNLAAVLSNERFPSEFIYPWIKRNIDKITSWKSGGAQASLNQNSIKRCLLLVPDEVPLELYTTVVRPMFDLVGLNCYTSDRLSELRYALLPKLMAGKIRIPVEAR